jgi:hypothetical protein
MPDVICMHVIMECWVSSASAMAADLFWQQRAHACTVGWEHAYETAGRYDCAGTAEVHVYMRQPGMCNELVVVASHQRVFATVWSPLDTCSQTSRSMVI